MGQDQSGPGIEHWKLARLVGCYQFPKSIKADKQSPLALRLRQCLFDLNFEDLENRALPWPPWPQKKGRADYLRRTNHDVIIEQKDIHISDVTSFKKLTIFTNDGIKRYNQSWKSFDVTLWDGVDEAHYLNMRAQARKRFSRRFRDANEQIRDTREILGLLDSYGLVLVVNQLAGNLDDGLCCSLMGEILEEQTNNGELRYPEIDGFLYIQNLQRRKTFDGKDSVFFSMLHDIPRSDAIAPMVKEVYAKFYPGADELRHIFEVFT